VTTDQAVRELGRVTQIAVERDGRRLLAGMHISPLAAGA